MNILIVEDDPMVRSINLGFVKKMDVKSVVFEASDTVSAKKILTENKIDLILLDVYLGNDSGPNLLKWVREHALNCDVILITADNSAQTVETAFRLGAIDYLIKPFHFGRFQEAVCKVITRKKQLNSMSSMNQDALDGILSSESSKDLKTEKGINLATYDIVKSVMVNSKEPLTAGDISVITSLARVTVRRYLEFMVEENYVTENYHYGKIGRPQKTYFWTGERD